MKLKFLATSVLSVSVTIIACKSPDSNQQPSAPTANNSSSSDTTTSSASGSEKTGVGKFQHVDLTHPLDQSMVAAGKSIYDLKCASCHKLTDEKLVGPGWKGVTDRRTPEWIMNFVTNTDEMLEKNQAAKNLYEICLVKMPNQNLSDDDARHILEFQRSNDGKK